MNYLSNRSTVFQFSFKCFVWYCCPCSSHSIFISGLTILLIEMWLKAGPDFEFHSGRIHLIFFLFSNLTYLILKERKGNESHIFDLSGSLIFFTPFCSVPITKMKKREISMNLGKNDESLSRDPLKLRTIEYLPLVPRRDMFLNLAFQILLLFILYYNFQ